MACWTRPAVGGDSPGSTKAGDADDAAESGLSGRHGIADTDLEEREGPGTELPTATRCSVSDQLPRQGPSLTHGPDRE